MLFVIICYYISMLLDLSSSDKKRVLIFLRLSVCDLGVEMLLEKGVVTSIMLN